MNQFSNTLAAGEQKSLHSVLNKCVCACIFCVCLVQAFVSLSLLFWGLQSFNQLLGAKKRID